MIDKVIEKIPQNITGNKTGPGLLVQSTAQDYKTFESYQISNSALINHKTIWSFKHPNLI